MPNETLTLDLPSGETVSALWQAPPVPRAVLTLAHGAGAGMTHRYMTDTADGLEARGVATLRFQFPYMEKGGKRPDRPAMFIQRLREKFPSAPVTEAHPKALALAHGGWTSELMIALGLKWADREHERDAILAAIAAREGFEVDGAWIWHRTE